MASLSEATVSVLVWSSSSILSHSLKSRSLSVPLSSVPLHFFSSRQLSVAAKPNDSALLALNWFNLLWSLSFSPGDLALRILSSMLRLPFLLAVVRGARSGFSFSLFTDSFICFSVIQVSKVLSEANALEVIQSEVSAFPLHRNRNAKFRISFQTFITNIIIHLSFLNCG